MKNILELDWVAVSRQSIPGVMLGMEKANGLREPSPLMALDKGADAAIGFDRTGFNGSLPRIVVMHDQKVPEILSWLHTYSPETFPLSQYCRVLTSGDWEMLNGRLVSHVNNDRLQRWANVIAGEMLSQAESAPAVISVPLGWAHGCLSFAVARNSMLFGAQPSEMFAAVGTRLMILEADEKFQSKKIGVSALHSSWAITELTEVATDADQAVLEIVARFDPKIGELMRSNEALFSSSAEKRILGFDTIADRMMSLPAGSDSALVSGGLAIAAAAFLAGRGTSHISLIEPFAKKFLSAYLWFGLLAGAIGPKSWDFGWQRLAKGVERLLGASYSLIEAPQSDISWPEYEWLSRAPGVSDPYGSLQKNNSRSITVELFPGVSCQFRMALNVKGQEGGLIIKEKIAPIERVVQPDADGENKRLMRAVRLLDELRDLILPSREADTLPLQSTLEGVPPKANTKGKVIRKNSKQSR